MKPFAAINTDGVGPLRTSARVMTRHCRIRYRHSPKLLGSTCKESVDLRQLLEDGQLKTDQKDDETEAAEGSGWQHDLFRWYGRHIFSRDPQSRDQDAIGGTNSTHHTHSDHKFMTHNLPTTDKTDILQANVPPNRAPHM